MDAEDQRLLLKGLCRQLGVVTDHPHVATDPHINNVPVKAPVVRVRLVKPIHLLPKQSALVLIKLEDKVSLSGPILVEALDGASEITLVNSLLQKRGDKQLRAVFTNQTSFMYSEAEAWDLGWKSHRSGSCGAR